MADQHQAIIDHCDALHAMMESVKGTTDHPEVLAGIEALQAFAKAHAAHATRLGDEHDAARADHDDTPHE